MRSRFLSLGLSVALVAPASGGVIAAVTAAVSARPAGAVSTTPAWTISTSKWNRSSSPTIADVNGDSTNDVVIGHQDGQLRVVSGVSGGNVSGWPQNAGGAIDSTPAVGDLNNDAANEIVVGVGSTWVNNQQGGVVIYNRNGTRKCTFRTRDYGNIWANTPGGDGYAEAVFSSPAIGDVNGDGYNDVVFGAFDLHVYAIDRNCNKIIDYMVEDSVWSSPALYDIDGDSRMEIFIGGDQTAGGWIDHSGGEFRALKWSPSSPGGAYELWKRQINDVISSSPAIGDINGDGRVEVVVGGGFFYNRDGGRKIYAWHADNGQSLGGWPVSTGGHTFASPALGDLTGDGVPEVAVSSSDGWVRTYRGSGALHWAKQLTFNNGGNGGPVASPIIADMNGDGINDVGAGNTWGFHILHGTAGGLQSQVNIWLSYETAGAVGYFGSSTGWRLIVSGFNTPGQTSTLRAYDMATPGKTPPWPMFRRDALHKAGPVGKNLLPPGYCFRGKNPKASPKAASANGYWVVASNGSIYSLLGAPYKGGPAGRVRGHAVGMAPTGSGGGYFVLDAAGQIFPYGDARSYGSMAGKRLNAPIIGMASTPNGKGYWLLGRDGGVFTFGNARFFGSTGNRRLNKPIIAMAATKTGRGYWLLASDGGVFTFGDARFFGSTGNLKLNAPIISMATSPNGSGYWLIARDGGVFAFNVRFYGSIPGIGLCRPTAGVQIRPTLTGNGYYVLGVDGRVWPFGDARGGKSTPPLINNAARDMAVRPYDD